MRSHPFRPPTSTSRFSTSSAPASRFRAGTVAVVLGAVAVLVASACGANESASGSSSTEPDADKLAVVATTTQVADFARNVGGEAITLTQVLKPNVDPHDYEPSPADVQAITRAGIVVKNGVGLEKWLGDTLSSAGFKGTVVDASQGVTIREGSSEHGGQGTEGSGGGAKEDLKREEGDPHIWHNPQFAKIMVANIEKAFAKADPDNASTYQANLASYSAKLDELDAKIQQQVDAIPADQRKLVTNHDAFGYYIDRYKLEFAGSIIPSFDTSAELSGKDVADLVAKIRTTGVTAIFSESSLPPKTAETLGKEAGVRVVAGEDSLYGDTLGPESSDGGTYLKMLEHNTQQIVEALRG